KIRKNKRRREASRSRLLDTSDNLGARYPSPRGGQSRKARAQKRQRPRLGHPRGLGLGLRAKAVFETVAEIQRIVAGVGETWIEGNQRIDEGRGTPAADGHAPGTGLDFVGVGEVRCQPKVQRSRELARPEYIVVDAERSAFEEASNVHSGEARPGIAG